MLVSWKGASCCSGPSPKTITEKCIVDLFQLEKLESTAKEEWHSVRTWADALHYDGVAYLHRDTLRHSNSSPIQVLSPVRVETAWQCSVDTHKILIRSRGCNSCLQIYWVYEFVVMREFVGYL